MRWFVVIMGAILVSPASAQEASATPAWVGSAPAATIPQAQTSQQAASPTVAPPPAAPQSEASLTAEPSESTSTATAGKDVYRKVLREKAEALGVPFELADAVTEVESSYNRAAVGGVGEIGLMQVLPSTARMLGFSGTLRELAEPETNIHYGVTYLAQAWRLANADICTAVMKYRAGHGESRFSHRSVDYCIRVRRGLAARGYTVTGEVPKATFGEPVGGTRVAGRGGRKSRLNWRAADARWRAVTGKIDSGSLTIMQ